MENGQSREVNNYANNMPFTQTTYERVKCNGSWVSQELPTNLGKTRRFDLLFHPSTFGKKISVTVVNDVGKGGYYALHLSEELRNNKVKRYRLDKTIDQKLQFTYFLLVSKKPIVNTAKKKCDTQPDFFCLLQYLLDDEIIYSKQLRPMEHKCETRNKAKLK